MGLQEFRILFENPNAVFEPGQTINGKVILTIDSKKKFNAIKVTIKGVGEVHWEERRSETRDGKTHYYTDHYRANEEYFRVQFFVLGSPSGERIELQPGQYIYPFSCTLNTSLPSSFEGDYGYIRYTVKATLDRPWKFDQDTKKAFSVVSHLDLNQLRNISEPIMVEKTKTFCCLCCATKPLNLNVSVPIRGYVPGQKIPVKIDIENYSGVTIEEVKLKLNKTITYTATSPRRKEKNVSITILKSSKGPIGGVENVNYVQTLEIPSLPPSNLQNCIIDVEYCLHVEACVSGCHKNISVYIPIIIGTIPLLSYQMPQLMSEPGWVHPSAPAAPPEPSAPPLDEPPSYRSVTAGRYPDIAPPSYEESVFGTNDLRDHGESANVIGAGDSFAPRYPVYNFKSMQ